MDARSFKTKRLGICATSLCVILLCTLIWYAMYHKNTQDNAEQIEASTENIRYDQKEENREDIYRRQYERYAESHQIQLFSNELPPAVGKNVSLEENEAGDLVLNGVVFHEVMQNQVRENYFGWHIDLSCFMPYGIAPSINSNIYAYWESDQIVLLCLQSTDDQHIKLYFRDQSQILNPLGYSWGDLICNDQNVDARAVWNGHVSEENTLKQLTCGVSGIDYQHKSITFACKNHPGLFYIITILFEKKTNTAIVYNLKWGNIRLKI